MDLGGGEKKKIVLSKKCQWVTWFYTYSICVKVILDLPFLYTDNWCWFFSKRTG